MRASDDFKKFIEALTPALVSTAEKALSKGEHEPMMILIGDANQLVVLPVGMFFNKRFGAAGKDIAADLHRELASSDKVRLVIMVNEAWALIGDGKTEMPDMHKSLHDHPDRREAIMWNCRHGKEQLIMMAVIDPKTRKLDKPVVTDPQDSNTLSHGRMIGEGAHNETRQ